MTRALLEPPRTSVGSIQTHDPVELDMIVTPELRLKVDYEDMLKLCELNRDVNFEWDPDGTLYIIAPAAGGSSHKNIKICRQLDEWAEADGTGLAFDSSAGFILPNGMMRNADGAWVRRKRWDTLEKQRQERGFPPLAPDFVVELRSPSDSRQRLHEKMLLYIANGVRLAWLIDPIAGEVEIHRAGRPVEVIKQPGSLAGEDVLPGFVLDLKGILHN